MTMTTTPKKIRAAFSTGVRVLDDRLGSIISGETLYLVGPTGGGKTTTLMKILHHITTTTGMKGMALFTELAEQREKKPDGTYPDEDEVIDRKFGCALAGVEWRYYENTVADFCAEGLPTLTQAELDRAQACIAQARAWREAHLVIGRESHPTSAQISAGLDYCAMHGLAFLATDHLGLVSFEDERERNDLKKQEAGFERLVMKAKRLGVCFFPAGQMGKHANVGGTAPTIAGIRGAHGNASAAWLVVACGPHYKPTKGGDAVLVPGVIEYKVLKNRMGGGSARTALARVSFGLVRDLHGQEELSSLWAKATANSANIGPSQEVVELQERKKAAERGRLEAIRDDARRKAKAETKARLKTEASK